MPALYSRQDNRNPVHVIGPSIAYVPLSRGLFALIDSDDSETVSHLTWCAIVHPNAGHYAVAYEGSRPNRIRVRLHSWLLGLSGRETTGDHVLPGNGLDNRRANIRVACQSEQLCNRRRQSNNTSGYKGVSWDAKAKKWMAMAQLRRVKYYLGLYSSASEAHEVYVRKVAQLHGTFARTE